MGEFEEVGNTIKEFASEDATVVVGTVIDPDMKDEIRVTVVATGLGKIRAQKDESPVKLVQPQSQVQLASKSEDALDYNKLDRPTVVRQKAVGAEMMSDGSDDLDYLDIPAFLRRQAD